MLPKLTVGTAVYKDYYGLYFTIQSIRMHHRAELSRLEIVVIDNKPDCPDGETTAKYCKRIGAKYVPFADWTGTTVKGKIFDHAETDYVLYLDSHVLLAADSISRLLAYFDMNKSSNDLIHGVLLMDDLVNATPYMDSVWRGNMWGTWNYDDPRGKSPFEAAFEIPQHGMGMFACRKDAWPGFHPMMRGFGGEEGYIHEKFRARGDCVMCLPGVRWVHRFDRPGGVPFTLREVDTFRNYIIGFLELGLDLTPVVDAFAHCIDPEKATSLIKTIRSAMLDSGYPVIDYVKTPKKTPVPRKNRTDGR